MRRTISRKLLLGTIAATLIAGGSVAVIAAGDTSPRKKAHAATHRDAVRARVVARSADVAAAASYLGLSKAQLGARLRSGQTLTRIAAGIAGRSPAGLVDAIAAARAARLTAALAAGRLTPAREHRLLAGVRKRVSAAVSRHRRGAAARRPVLSAAASYLGVSLAQLRATLRRGQTLAQIAEATPGRSAAGLIAALESERRAILAERMSKLQKQLTTLVNRRLAPAG
ncbi:MAG: hypothetical protein QOI03_989 [Solirubrobacteraceae bacterium]|jgi:hypothetical protein|nr:hypothetical protein [Solirubrobacteraceae bacterium]